MKWLICAFLIIPNFAFAAEASKNSVSSESLAVQAPTSPQMLINESEIPVTLEATKKAEGSTSPFTKIILTLAVIGVLGAGAFFLVRKYSFKSGGKDQSTQIKVISQHYLGPRKSIAMIRVAGESILVGITDHNINHIKTLSLLDEDIPEETPTQFNSVFKAAANQNIQAAGSIEPGEDFSITGIKDFVTSKLKNMRTLE